MYKALAILVLVSCAAKPQVLEPVQTTTAPWCFKSIVLFNKKDQVAIGCFESEPLCGNAQRRAIKYGGLAGIKQVGECKAK